MTVYEQLPVTSPTRATRRACAVAFGVSEVSLIGRKRSGPVMLARLVTYYVLRKRFSYLSLTQIARIMGGRDHTTVLNGIRRCEALIARDPDLRRVVEGLVDAGFGEQRDSHVKRWHVHLAFLRNQVRQALRAQQAGPQADLADDELAEFRVPDREFCGQCDRSVTGAEKARCAQRFCPRSVQMKVAA